MGVWGAGNFQQDNALDFVWREVQQPLIRQTWYSYLAQTLATFFAGLALSSTALALRFDVWWLALACGWFLTLAAARSMILVIAHQCIHKQFSGRPDLDRVGIDTRATEVQHIHVHGVGDDQRHASVQATEHEKVA